MTLVQKNIRHCSIEEIGKFCKQNGLPKFRANQIHDWLWKYRVLDFDNMTNLSLIDRKLFNAHFYTQKLNIIRQNNSVDGTIKFLFQSHDNQVVEGVLIPHLNRLTACISSQVGCSLACTFCATGKLKLARNLKFDEIYDQVFLINQYCLENFNQPLTNIVYMGMGEPLLNITNVLMSINYISSKQGMDFSYKRITVSTAGIVKAIKTLADSKVKFNLAISLHSANNQKRSEIMEINKSNNLERLADAIDYFYNKTKIKPTYEYILLKGFNDSIKDAEELVSFCKKTPSKVNLIEYNKVKDLPYEKSTKKSTSLFINILEKNKILVKLRKSRGEDIGAACGQLATQNISDRISKNTTSRVRHI